MQKAEGNSGEYLIVDMDLEVDTSVPKTWLEEPTFNLVGWYQQHLDQHEFFEQRYYESHREELLPMTPPSSNEWHTCRFSHELRGCPEASGTAETPMEWAPRNKEPEIRMSVDKNNGENHVEELLTGDTFWDDMPVLQPMSEGSDDEEFEEGPLDSEEETFGSTLEELLRSESPVKIDVSEDELIEQIQTVLTQCQPFPGDGESVDPTYHAGERRFVVEKQSRGFYCVYD